MPARAMRFAMRSLDTAVSRVKPSCSVMRQDVAGNNQIGKLQMHLEFATIYATTKA
jgi:hypothetical protein